MVRKGLFSLLPLLLVAAGTTLGWGQLMRQPGPNWNDTSYQHGVFWADEGNYTSDYGHLHFIHNDGTVYKNIVPQNINHFGRTVQFATFHRMNGVDKLFVVAKQGCGSNQRARLSRVNPATMRIEAQGDASFDSINNETRTYHLLPLDDTSAYMTTSNDGIYRVNLQTMTRRKIAFNPGSNRECGTMVMHNGRVLVEVYGPLSGWSNDVTQHEIKVIDPAADTVVGEVLLDGVFNFVRTSNRGIWVVQAHIVADTLRYSLVKLNRWGNDYEEANERVLLPINVRPADFQTQLWSWSMPYVYAGNDGNTLYWSVHSPNFNMQEIARIDLTPNARQVEVVHDAEQMIYGPSRMDPKGQIWYNRKGGYGADDYLVKLPASNPSAQSTTYTISGDGYHFSSYPFFYTPISARTNSPKMRTRGGAQYNTALSINGVLNVTVTTINAAGVEYTHGLDPEAEIHALGVNKEDFFFIKITVNEGYKLDEGMPIIKGADLVEPSPEDQDKIDRGFKKYKLNSDIKSNPRSKIYWVEVEAKGVALPNGSLTFAATDPEQGTFIVKDISHVSLALPEEMVEAMQEGPAFAAESTLIRVLATPQKPWVLNDIVVTDENGESAGKEPSSMPNSACFRIPKGAKVTVKVTFKLSLELKLDASAGGTLTAKRKDVALQSGDHTLLAGQKLVFTTIPDEGYELESLTVNGAAYESGKEFEVPHVEKPEDAKVVVKAVFKKPAEPKPTAVESALLAGVRATPNPVREMLRIENAEAVTSWAIYNCLGQPIASGTARGENVIAVPAQSWANGLYLIRLEAADGGKTIRVVK